MEEEMAVGVLVVPYLPLEDSKFAITPKNAKNPIVQDFMKEKNARLNVTDDHRVMLIADRNVDLHGFDAYLQQKKVDINDPTALDVAPSKNTLNAAQEKAQEHLDTVKELLAHNKWHTDHVPSHTLSLWARIKLFLAALYAGFKHKILQPIGRFFFGGGEQDATVVIHEEHLVPVDDHETKIAVDATVQAPEVNAAKVAIETNIENPSVPMSEPVPLITEETNVPAVPSVLFRDGPCPCHDNDDPYDVDDGPSGAVSYDEYPDEETAEEAVKNKFKP